MTLNTWFHTNPPDRQVKSRKKKRSNEVVQPFPQVKNREMERKINIGGVQILALIKRTNCCCDTTKKLWAMTSHIRLAGKKRNGHNNGLTAREEKKKNKPIKTKQLPFKREFLPVTHNRGKKGLEMSLACGNGADHLLLCVAISFKATMWKEPWLHLVAWHSKGKKIAVFTRKSSRFLTLGYFHFSRVPNLNYLSKTVPTRRNNKKKHVFFQQNGRTLANGICRITFVSTSICQLITGKNTKRFELRFNHWRHTAHPYDTSRELGHHRGKRANFAWALDGLTCVRGGNVE